MSKFQSNIFFMALLLIFTSCKYDQREDSNKKHKIHKKEKSKKVHKVITNIKEFSPEFSGIVFDPVFNKFLIVSDDYDHATPALITMDVELNIANDLLQIVIPSKIEDNESISLVGNSRYVMSSLSKNKNGEAQISRQRFIQLERVGSTFKQIAVVDFRTLLLNAFKGHSDKKIKKVYKKVKDVNKGHDIEIEGHFIENDNLFLSFKRPDFKYILKIANFNSIFSMNKIRSEDVSIYLKIELERDSKISDIIKVGEYLYFSTVENKADTSSLWRRSINTSSIELMEKFNHKKLEGITYDYETKSIFGVFDDPLIKETFKYQIQ